MKSIMKPITEDSSVLEMEAKMLYDKDIREPLFDFLEETYGKNRILEEKRTGRSRADVVMVTPKALYGIEIKSDADTYARLAGQVKDYDKFYDYNIAVNGIPFVPQKLRNFPAILEHRKIQTNPL